MRTRGPSRSRSVIASSLSRASNVRVPAALPLTPAAVLPVPVRVPLPATARDGAAPGVATASALAGTALMRAGSCAPSSPRASRAISAVKPSSSRTPSRAPSTCTWYATCTAARDGAGGRELQGVAALWDSCTHIRSRCSSSETSAWSSRAVE